MLKRILVPLDHSPFTDGAIELACNLAAQNEAELTGLVVIDIQGIQRSIGPVPLGASKYAQKLERSRTDEADRHIRSLLASFHAKCKEAGVSHKETEIQGRPHDSIVHESIYYDATVMGLRTFFNFEDKNKAGVTLDKVLVYSIGPVIGAPGSPIEVDFASKMRVLIPFNGSIPSVRSLHRFAAVADPDLSEVTLVMSDPDEQKARYQLKQAGDYLESHGFRSVHTEWSNKDIISLIDKRYLEYADIVVVGAHSKISLVDFMVGSVAKHVIGAAMKPVIIGQ